MSKTTTNTYRPTITATALMMMTAMMSSPSTASADSFGCITEQEVINVISAFANAVPAISQAFHINGGGRGEDPSSLKREACQAAYDGSVGALNAAYGYSDESLDILFKPTVTTSPYTFRPTYQGALSYFIGTDCLSMVGTETDQFPEGNSGKTFSFREAGFALNNMDGSVGWKDGTTMLDFRYFTSSDDDENNVYCDNAVAQGQMCFQHADGSGESCVDKSFGVKRRQQDGAAVLVLHHSSSMIQGDDSIVIRNTAIIPPFIEVPRDHPFTTQGECISQGEAEAVVNAFAGAVPAISSVFHSHKDGMTAEDPSTLTEEACLDAYNAAMGALQAAYGYDEESNNGGTVLFKPTLTERPLTFRPTYQGALSYFIGTDCLDLVGKDIDQFPKTDSEFREAGFALNNANGSIGWSGADVSADFTYLTDGDNCHTALAQGQICFEHTDSGVDKSCVDKTFAFNRRESDNAVVISLHHSSAVISEEDSQVICQRGSLIGNECIEGPTRKRNLRGN